MKITNNKKLPEALVDAIRNDPYEDGGADISVTRLIGAPRINALTIKHKDELTADASTMLWSLMGQAMHSIMERAGEKPGRIMERRFFGEMNGMTISGQADLIEGDILSDYKFMSVWEIIYGFKAEKAAQLNVLRWLARGEGVEVDTLHVVSLLRDWMASKAKTDVNYPSEHIITTPIPVWPQIKVEMYIAEQVEAHAKAKTVLPECSEEDRWYTGDLFAVMKSGRKSALAVKGLDTMEKAMEWCLAHGYMEADKLTPGIYVEFRPGESKRCEMYCAVSALCDQYQKSIDVKGA
jgi:hypothetical protein